MSLRTCSTSGRILGAVCLMLIVLSAPFRASADSPPRIAVLPPHNLTGKGAPLKEIHEAFKQGLSAGGAVIPGDDELERFMERHRIRYTNGMDTLTAEAFREESGVDGVFIISLERYDTVLPLKIALTARLISTGEDPRIVWTDSVALSGDEHPGIFGTGLIEDPEKLRERAVEALLDSLRGKEPAAKGEGSEISRPQVLYRSPVVGGNLRETPVFFTGAHASGPESKSLVRIPVALGSPRTRPVKIDYVLRGSAVAGVDYEVKKRSLIFPPGETIRLIDIAVLDNALNQQNRSIEVQLVSPRNAVIAGPTVYTYTILDDDPEPEVSFGTASVSVNEHEGPILVPVDLSIPSGRDVVVPFRTEGTAANYTIASRQAVIRAGETRAFIEIVPVANGVYEDDGMLLLHLGVPVHAVPGRIAATAVTIVNTDPLPELGFARAESRSKGNAEQGWIEVSLSGPSSKQVSVQCRVTGGTAVQGKDFWAAEGTISFPPGELKKTIQIVPADDGVHRDDRTAEISLSDPDNAVIGGNSVHVHHLAYRVPPPVVRFLDLESRGSELEPSATVEVILSGPSRTVVHLEYSRVGGTAVEGVNYETLSGTLVFEPGETIRTIPIRIRRDMVNSEPVTIELALKNARNAQLVQGVHVFTIIDGDPEPAVSFSASAHRISEDQGMPVPVMVELSAVSGRDVVVPFFMTGAPDGFAAGPNPVVIRAGTLIGRIDLTSTANGLDEEDRAVMLRLGTPVHASPGSRTSAAVTVVNSDPPPTMGFVTPESRSDEGAVKGIEVALSGPSAKPVSVELRVTGGTAVKGRDFSLHEGRITFAPGETRKPVVVVLAQGDRFRRDRTVELGLRLPVHGVVGGAARHIHTAAGGRPLPKVSFQTPERIIRKSNRTVDVGIRLSEVSGEDAIIHFSVTGAGPGETLTATPNPVVISAGMLNQAIRIDLTGLNRDRPSESGKERVIEVVMTSADGAALTRQTAHRILEADETPPTIALVPFSNRSEARNAGEIVAQRFIAEIVKSGKFNVVEPGVVRQRLLNGRIIMPQGVSLTDAEYLFNTLESDLIVTGKIAKYRETEPLIQLDVQVYERKSRKMVWSSRSIGRAGDGVVLFERGRPVIVERVVSDMVKAIIESMTE